MSRNLSTIERITALIETGELSQAKIAREAGVSSSAVSAVRKGDYAGDSENVIEKLKRWLAIRDRKENGNAVLPVAPEWVETPTSAKILPVLAYSQMANDVAVLHGAAGVGKTKALEHYAANNPNVWLVTMSPDTSGVAGALSEIAWEMGITDIKKGAARYRREIVRKIKGTEGLLIIDEAQHLTVPALESVRTIHDRSGIGLVLCGNESVYVRMTGGSRQATFAQLFSRIGKRLRLARPMKTDCYAVLTAFGVPADKEIKAIAAEIGLKPGGLRGLTKTLRLAGMIAAGEGQAVDAGFVRSAWAELNDIQEVSA